jgi:tetraacyldisaccharide 4'-kinase
MSFGDHHSYSTRDIRQIESEAARSGAEALVTTAKDAVKLDLDAFSMPCIVVEIEVRIDHPERFASMI